MKNSERIYVTAPECEDIILDNNPDYNVIVDNLNPDILNYHTECTFVVERISDGKCFMGQWMRAHNDRDTDHDFKPQELRECELVETVCKIWKLKQ